MRQLIKSKFQTLTFLLLILFITSCDRGCVEPYQFDSENRYVNANPIDDGIFGGQYNNISGGEIAAWHSTDIVSDGKQLVFELRGAWTAWDEANSEAELNALPECKICAKNQRTRNCLCLPEEVPIPEKDGLGNPLNFDCSIQSNQDDPARCSCTKFSGSINDFGTYFIATNYQNKDESLKFPDDQEPCRYEKGMGLYVGLFGKNGNTMPIRVYQMYPTQAICDINRDLQGGCVDESGRDQTKYVYKSPNGKTFIKDDGSGNNGSDVNPDDDEYHKAGEVVKLIINDRYYRDNYGGYDINFMSGFFRTEDSGLLEYIVGNVEDIILGKISADGSKRSGGALEFLYNSIVKDSTFIAIVQICLVLYIVLFGFAVLSGTVQISTKEMMMRIVQISLIIFFTDPKSWYFYNQIVVGFFKNGMDAIIAIFMNASDKAFDPSSLVITSQLERANSLSHSTRFTSADVIIQKLFSSDTSKKILSLIFGEWLGIIYAVVIYVLIFAFAITMLMAALMYIKILLGLIFVLCLGPIFMVTLLFGSTKPIFKRWLAYLASQSMQIICLFLIIYLFIVLIDKDFTEMLYYRACTVNINFGLFNINFLRSETTRSIMAWLGMFVKIGALIYLLQQIMKKIPGFVGHMVSVGGTAADQDPNFVSNTNSSAFGLAGDLFKQGMGAAQTAWKNKSGVISLGKKAAGFVARKTGLSSAISGIRRATPFRGPMRRWEDRKVDKMIAAQKGKSNAAIRKAVIEQGRKDGISDRVILNRLEQKLEIEPMKKAVVDAIKEIKKEKGADVPLDSQEMRDAVKEKIEKWITDNGHIAEKDRFMNLLERDTMKSLIRQEGELSSSEAAKAFAGNQKNKDRYLQHLNQKQAAQRVEGEAARSKWHKNFGHNMKKFANGLRRNNADNPNLVRRNFLAKVDAEENYKNRKAYGVMDAFGNKAARAIDKSPLGVALGAKQYAKQARQEQKAQYKKYFENDEGVKKDLEEVENKKVERVKRVNEQYKNDVAMFNRNVADKNRLDAMQRVEEQRQEDIRELEKKVNALKRNALNLIDNEDYQNQKEFQKGKIDGEKYDQLQAENDALKDIIDKFENIENVLNPKPAQPYNLDDSDDDDDSFTPPAPSAPMIPDDSDDDADDSPASSSSSSSPQPQSTPAPSAPPKPDDAKSKADLAAAKQNKKASLFGVKSKLGALASEYESMSKDPTASPAKLLQLKNEISQLESEASKIEQEIGALDSKEED